MASNIRRNWTLAVVFFPPLLWAGAHWHFALRTAGHPRTSSFETAWSADDWSRLPAVGERCVLINNVWNKRPEDRDLEQEIFNEYLDGKPALGWRWYAPLHRGHGVVTYPELVCGSKPWGSQTAAFPGMPFHPGERHPVAAYDIRLSAEGSYNMAFSLWAVSALPPSPDGVRCEVMIWIANQGQRPSGTHRGIFEVGGVPYDLYINQHQRDASGKNQGEWTYATFVAQTPVLSGPLDIGAFIDELEFRDVLPKELWITDVELGNEVSEGSGIAEIQNFDLRMQ